jgi:hypothetical protein
MAVGYSQTSGGEVPFTEQLSKSSTGWSASKKATSLPATDTIAYLDSVSCTAANACVAVGYAYGSASNSYRGNYYVSWGGSGTTWSVPKPVAAASSFTQLSSISCAKATTAACVAVGSGEASQLSGSTWTELAPPSLNLGAVSCTAANACTAVGGSSIFFFDKTTDPSATGTASSSSSSNQPPAPPVGPAASFAAAQKAAQTAPTQNAPQAAGTSAPAPSPAAPTTSTATHTTAAARWTGGAGSAAWAVQSTLSPTGAQYAFMGRVSCAGGKCLAIGSEYQDGSGVQPLAEAGPGTWSIQPGIGTTSGSYYGYLNDVSCVPAGTGITKCLVVGTLDSPTQSGAMSQLVTSGSTWSAAAPVYLKLPTGANWVYVNGVSCTTVSSCTAVGDYYNSTVSENQPLVEHWNGTGWTIQTITSPSTTQSVSLSGVSCAVTGTVTGCSAVGSEYNSSTHVGTAIAESWNGSKYVPQKVTLPSGTTNSSLGRVSCSAATTCTGIGTASSSSFYGSLAERLASGSWSSQTFTASTFTFLNGISCPTSASCTAVGGAAALQWTSGGWGNPVPMLAPAGDGYYATVEGVSCSSASSCTAAGYGYLAVAVPLAEILS